MLGAFFFGRLFIILEWVTGVMKMLEVVFVFIMDKPVAMTFERSGPGLGVNWSWREPAKIADLSLEENK